MVGDRSARYACCPGQESSGKIGHAFKLVADFLSTWVHVNSTPRLSAQILHPFDTGHFDLSSNPAPTLTPPPTVTARIPAPPSTPQELRKHGERGFL